MRFGQKLIGMVGSVAVSAAAAGLFVQLTSVPVPAQAEVAGIERIQMLRNEHALVADTVAQRVQVQREANLAADRDALSMRIAAAESVTATPVVNFAEAKRNPAVVMPARKLASHEPQIAPETAQPLQLAALMEPPKVAPPAGNIVTRQIHTVVATVERVPAWMLQAANWVAELPAQALPRLTQRRHFSISL